MAKKSNTGKIVILLILIAAIAGGSIYYIKSKKSDAIEVQVSKVEKRTITKIVTSVGKIQPETEVKVFSETSGELIMLDVKEGDIVQGGSILAKIKPDIIQSQLEGAEAGVKASNSDIEVAKATMNRTKTELDRVKKLHEKKYVSDQDLLLAQTAYEQAKSNHDASISRMEQTKASVRQIQYSAVRTTIYSPINGVVTKLNAKKGEKVLGQAQFTGTELMRVSDLSIMNAEVDVDENDIVNVKIGDTSLVEVDAFPDEVFKGVVVEIANAAKSSELSSQDQVVNFKIKIRLINLNSKFRPGMSCNVQIITETHPNVISVPLMAVASRKEEEKASNMKDDSNLEEAEKTNKKKSRPKTYVFVKKGDIVSMKQVETGLNSQDYIEIKSGVNEGEEIISGPYSAVSKELLEGSKVKLEDKSKLLKSKK